MVNLATWLLFSIIYRAVHIFIVKALILYGLAESSSECERTINGIGELAEEAEWQKC